MAELIEEKNDAATGTSPQCRHKNCDCMSAENGYCSAECQATDLDNDTSPACPCSHPSCGCADSDLAHRPQ